MTWTIDALDPGELAAASVVLAEACTYDRAAEVAGEKLFGADRPEERGALRQLVARRPDQLRVVDQCDGAIVSHGRSMLSQTFTC